MTARSRYEIKVTGGSIEVVDLDDLEVVLFWDCRPKERRRMAEGLIRDLDRLEPDEFLRRWSAAQPADFS
jgi:hypothetical protein